MSSILDFVRDVKCKTCGAQPGVTRNMAGQYVVCCCVTYVEHFSLPSAVKLFKQSSI